jgi:2',3'-cyclic-nucleotide 2'-phosphodiesterase (5'-nucleotidase family)
MRVLFALVLPAMGLAACVAFNDACPVDRSEVVGETQRALDVRPSALRLSEAPAGNLLADALLAGTQGAQVAVVPAGLFQQSTGCEAREFLSRGNITEDDIAQLLPSEESVWLLRITSDDLKRIFERSVNQLATSSPENPGFLQIAGALFGADCSETAQSLSPDGKSILYPGARVAAAGIFVGGQRLLSGQMLSLAVPSSLATGTFGYIDLTRPGLLLLDTQKTPRQMLVDYLRRKSPVDPPIEGRVLLRDSCR